MRPILRDFFSLVTWYKFTFAVCQSYLSILLQRLLLRNQVPVFSSLWASYVRVTADMKVSRIGWQRDFLWRVRGPCLRHRHSKPFVYSVADGGRFPFLRTDRPARVPIVMRISLLIKTNHPDQSNPKYYAQRRWFFSKTSWQNPILLPKCLVRPWSGRPVLTFGKRPEYTNGLDNTWPVRNAGQMGPKLSA